MLLHVHKDKLDINKLANTFISSNSNRQNGLFFFKEIHINFMKHGTSMICYQRVHTIVDLPPYSKSFSSFPLSRNVTKEWGGGGGGGREGGMPPHPHPFHSCFISIERQLYITACYAHFHLYILMIFFFFFCCVYGMQGCNGWSLVPLGKFMFLLSY